MKQKLSILDRFAGRMFGRIILWFYPDLCYFKDAGDRWAALFVIEQTLPKWLQRMKFALWAIAFIGGGVGGMVLGLMIVQQFNIQGKRMREIITLIGAMAGTIILLTVFFGIDSLTMRRRRREFLHNIGRSTCPCCGYDLEGHLDFKDLHCPECGQSIDFST